jgi:enoyl-CoA hydratase/carnithine racemase
VTASPSPATLAQFTVETPAPGYWRVVFSNPPINLLNSTTVVELGAIVNRIEQTEDLRVVLFVSEHPDFSWQDTTSLTRRELHSRQLSPE